MSAGDRQNGVEPAADLAAVEQMLRAQSPQQRVLDEVVGKLRVTRQRASVPAQSRDLVLDGLPEAAHVLSFLSGRGGNVR